MIKTKKQMYIVIGVFALVMMLGTVTYAFFNYTRTGASNNFNVGRIAFRSKNEETITLNNLFPIDPSDSNAMNDDTKVGTYEIEIEGDTDYSGGIEYLVSIVDANIYTSTGKQVPISLNMTVNNGLGTNNDNYFTARENTNINIYKKLVGNTLLGDQLLLVGLIRPNTVLGTASGIDGKITIKAYLDKNKILISDTYDGTESDFNGTTNEQANGKTVLTTSEWNALKTSGVSFKVKVEANEGIWVTGTLEEIMKKNNIGVDTENGVDFSKTSDQDNTLGVYTRAGTENATYPIMYYRGAVEDNNVKFANKCWKAVRTTDTGGVKLIYNGEPSQVYGSGETNFDKSYYQNENLTNNAQNVQEFTFDNTTNEWKVLLTQSGQRIDSTFKLASAGDYYLILKNNYSDGQFSIYVNGTKYDISSSSEVKYIILNGTAGDEYRLNTILYYANEADFSFSLVEAVDLGLGCDNDKTDSQITLNEAGIDKNTFSFSGQNGNTPAYVGYMWGNNIYTSTSKNISSTFKFGTGFIYENGVYRLQGASDGIDNTRRYTCFTSSEICDGTDTGKVYYVYYNSSTTYYYFELINGKSIDDIFDEMQENDVDSNAKDKIDTWYLGNMTNYTNKLEDTIWCNDRSIEANDYYEWFDTNNSNAQFYYAPRQRSDSSSNNETKNKPSLVCVNKNDRFTVSNVNGNQKLDYPVAMITEDELVLAGVITGSDSTSYLITGSSYLTMSPNFYTYFVGSSVFIASNKRLGDGYPDSYGLRPMVSLKPGQLITKGTGTVTDPYVIS